MADGDPAVRADLAPAPGVKGAVGYYAYRVLTGLLGLLPEPIMRRFGYGVGWLGSFVARRRFRMAVRHQTRVAGTAMGARRAARRAFGWYGRYWAEVFWMRPRRRRRVLARSHLENVDRLLDAVASGRGVVVALPHLGNWEVAGLRAAAEGARVLAVAEELGNERIVQWFIHLRKMMDIDVVIARKGSRVTRDLLQRLQEGGVIALLCDRDLSGRGVRVKFFGEETTLPPGPVALADRTGAVLLPAGTYFAPGAGYRFVVGSPLEIPEGEDADERVRLGTQRLAEVIEDIIRVAPEQWHLIVPNWPSDRETAS
ncbi:MAG TPA: phosphatidylinositol mannoside acyltransferase [Acidimicrobiia bacterium]|nr:phosphatidylinositol mannoside acyltransferase [Acidimicrobiia bacterium]